MSEMYKIFVTNIINPDNFQAQIGNEESFESFRLLEENCNLYSIDLKSLEGGDDQDTGAEGSDNIAFLESLEEGQCVIAYSTQLCKWTRARVNMITEDEVDVNFIDYQITELVDCDHVITAVPDWVRLTKPMVYKCKLHGIKPLSSSWISRAANFLTKTVQSKFLDVHVIQSDKQQQGPTAPLQVDIRIETSDGLQWVTDLMKAEGLAMDMKPPAAAPPPAPNKLLKVEEQKTENRNSPVVPTFDVNQLRMKAIVSDPGSENEEDEEPDIEQQIFLTMKGAGQTYKQYQDSKITSGIPLHHQCSEEEQLSFSMTNITEQLREMKMANEKAENIRKESQSSSMNAQRSKMKSGEKRVGFGRGTPPPMQKSPIHEKPGREDLHNSPNPSVRPKQNSSPAQRPRRITDSPKGSTQPNRKGGKSIAVENRLNLSFTEEQKTNEEMWVLDQLKYKVNRELDKLSGKRMTLSEAKGSIKRLIYPDRKEKYTLSKLGKQSELEVGLECLSIRAVEHHEYHTANAIKLIQVVKGDKNFMSKMSELLWRLHTEYVRVRGNSKEATYVEGYCYFLAQLFIAAQDWEDNSSINSCVSNIVDKWINEIQHHKRGNAALYADCLYYFMSAGGKEAGNYLHLFSHIKDQAQHIMSTKDIPRPIKDKLVQVLEQREKECTVEENITKEKIKPTPGDMINLMDKQTFTRKKHGSGDKKTAKETKNDISEINLEWPKQKTTEQKDLVNKTKTEKSDFTSTKDQQQTVKKVNTVGKNELDTQPVIDRSSKHPYDEDSRRKGRIRIYEEVLGPESSHQKGQAEMKIHHIAKTLMDVAVQTDSVPEVSSSSCSTCSSRSAQRRDKFSAVRLMLHYLDLDEFLPVFMENGIRDSVFGLEFSEVKDLLKECGVKAGQILEIKAYLKKYNNLEDLCERKSDCSSSTSNYSDTVDSLSMLNPTLRQSTPSPLHMLHSAKDTISSVVSNNFASLEDTQGSKTYFPSAYITTSATMDKSTSQPAASNQTKTKGLFSPQDFEMSTISIDVSLPEFNTKEVTGSTISDTDKSANTIANAATRLPKMYNSINNSDVQSNGNMFTDLINGVSSQNTVKETAGHVNGGGSLSKQDSVSPTSTTRKYELFPHNNTLDDRGDNRRNSSSPENPNHPRTKYNFSSAKSIVDDWLSPTGSKSPGKEKITTVGSWMSPTGSKSPDEEKDVMAGSEDKHNNNHLLKDDSRIKVTKLNINESVSGNRKKKTVTSPASYMPPSPRDELHLLRNEFPSIHEASEISSSNNSRQHHASNVASTERSYMDNYREAMQIPDPDIIEQRTAQFGMQIPMCSYCGERGGHASHECPDKHNKMFY